MAEHNISDIVPEEFKERARKLADDHVNWLLELVRPLLITEFIHGYRHGYEDKENKK